MRIEAADFDEYIEKIPEDRKAAFSKLREVVNKHIPDGFEEGVSYSFPAWIVPFSIYPDGYHCKPEEPLPFVSLASQKNFIGFYHMGIYANTELYDWFVSEYPKHSKSKLDMGKSCIRFKKMDDIPFDLIGELMTKITVEDWIQRYETAIKK